MNEFSRISPEFSAEPLPLLPWAPERNGEAILPAPPPRPGFWARLAAWLGLHA